MLQEIAVTRDSDLRSLYPDWGEFGQTVELYRRTESLEVTRKELAERLDRQEVSGQLLRDIVLLEEQRSQCKHFSPIFPTKSDR